MTKKGIMLVNMGGARNEMELKLFLKNMFRDKRIIPSPLRYLISAIVPSIRYQKVWKNYEQIGGSQIYSITEKLVQEMQKTTHRKVVYAMRYTSPDIASVVSQFDDIIVIPMYPHYSTTTVESIIDEIEKVNFRGQIKILDPFYKNKIFNQLVINSIYSQIDKPEDWHLIFSAHGIPVTITRKGDPYTKQIREHAEILSKKLVDFKSISLGYQSKVGPVQWEKPYLNNLLKDYKGKNVLIYPISFLIDNSETDYELKIEYAKIAKKVGVNKYKVVDCLNDTKEFIYFLINLSK